MPAARTARRVLVTSVACAVAAGAAAQEPYAIGDGFRDSVRVAWSDVGARCLTTLRTGFVIPAVDSSCTVVALAALGGTEGDEWIVARYRRRAILADSLWRDTLDMDELVLVAHRPGAADARLVWHLVRDRDIEFLDTLRWAPTSHDLFLDLLVCLNGTGGCSDEYLRFDGGRWRYVAQPFVKDLQARLPADHWLHKGRRLDLEALTGVWPVAAPGDANCCPSLELPFSLALVRDALVLREAGVLRTGPMR